MQDLYGGSIWIIWGLGIVILNNGDNGESSGKRNMDNGIHVCFYTCVYVCVYVYMHIHAHICIIAAYMPAICPLFRVKTHNFVFLGVWVQERWSMVAVQTWHCFSSAACATMKP